MAPLSSLEFRFDQYISGLVEFYAADTILAAQNHHRSRRWRNTIERAAIKAQWPHPMSSLNGGWPSIWALSWTLYARS